MEDIKGLIEVGDLDLQYITNWIAELKLNTFDLL